MKNRKFIMRLFYSNGTHKGQSCNSARNARLIWDESIDRNEKPIRGEWILIENNAEYKLGSVTKGEYFSKQQLKRI